MYIELVRTAARKVDLHPDVGCGGLAVLAACCRIAIDMSLAVAADRLRLSGIRNNLGGGGRRSKICRLLRGLSSLFSCAEFTLPSSVIGPQDLNRH